MEDKVQKMLDLIKEEDEDEKDGNRVGKAKKEPLVELIEDFRKHYHQLYARYDHLTGELRKKVSRKQENGNSSPSSSDSDSEYSSKERGSKNGNTENEFQKVTDGMKQELENAHLEVADLRRKLADITEKKEGLEVEYQMAFNKIQEAEKIISDLKIEAETCNGEKSKFEIEIGDLNIRLQSSNTSAAEMNQKLEDIARERTDLMMERETALQTMKEREKIIEELKVMTNKLKDENKTLQVELSTVKEKLESSEGEVVNLIQMQKATEEKNNSLSAKILELSNEICEAQSRMHDLVAESSQLREKLDEREREFVNHTEMHEAHKNEASDRMRGLELELDSLHTQKTEAEKQKDDELSILLKKIEDKEGDFSSQIEDLRTKINDLNQEVESLQKQKMGMEEQLVHERNEASGQLKDLMEKVNEKQQELESLNTQKLELESQLEKKIQDTSECLSRIEILEEELRNKSAYQQRTLEEKEDLIAQVQGREQEVESLQKQKTELEDQNIELEKTLAERVNEISDLRKSYEDKENEASAQIANLTAQVSILQKEGDSLNAQKAGSELQLEKKALEIVQYIDEIENLKENLACKSREGQKMLEEGEDLKVQVKNLEMEVDSLINQKTNLEDQRVNQTLEIDGLRKEIEGLQERIGELEKTLTVRREELIDLQKKHEKVGDESTTQIMALTLQLNDKEDAFNKLSEEHRKLELLFQECKENLEVAERKVGETTEEIHLKDGKIDEFEETVEDLRRDLEMKGDEVSTLVENVRNLEVKLRLSNQKLRVTEQVLTEKEDSQGSRDEKFQQGLRSLEERVGSLSASVAIYREAQAKIIRDVSEKVKNMTNGVDTLTLKFEEDYGHFETRIYEILHEIQVVKNWVKERNCEKEELKTIIGSLVKQLEDKKEEESVLRERVGELEVNLGKVEEEKQNVMKALKLLEEKTEALEKMMSEKDEGISGISEEKREAIRQLCIWIDYHRSRCDDLKEILSKRSGRRPVAT